MDRPPDRPCRRSEQDRCDGDDGDCDDRLKRRRYERHEWLSDRGDYIATGPVIVRKFNYRYSDSLRHQRNQ